MESEFESSNPDGPSGYERLRALYAQHLEFFADAMREAHAAGESPTSIDELWRFHERPSDHNPHPRDRRPAAWDITPGWYAPPERWDLIADAEAAKRDYAKAHSSDGMWDVPPVKIPEPPGGWGWVRQADTAEGIPVYAFPDPPDGKMYQRGDDGGWWLVDDHGADEAVMRPIVEDAMYRIGINPRPRNSNPKGTTHDGK